MQRAAVCVTSSDSYFWTHLLDFCKTIKSVEIVHAQSLVRGLQHNPFLSTKLIAKYAAHPPHFHYALNLFDHLLLHHHNHVDVFLWNTLIQAHANVAPFFHAFHFYNHMRSTDVAPNGYTFPFLLKASASLKHPYHGRAVHAHLLKFGFHSHLYVSNALVAFYAKCFDIASSTRVFDEMPHRDIVSWNSMISGYTVNGRVNEALFLFQAMLRDFRCVPDHATFVSLLPACAQAAALHVGCWVHVYVIKSGIRIDAVLGSGLISMYGNSGRIGIARDIFDRISDKNVVVWSAMMRSYGMQGYAGEAFALFSKFIEAGLRPDAIMFVCLLSTCSHTGMVTKGWEIFHKMDDFGVEKTQEHYACMVDLLGRAGKLDEAVELINTMPSPAGTDVYGALLSACRMHNNMNIAEILAEKLYVIDPENAGRYITMAKMYEDAGKPDDVARVRKALKEKNIRKPIGFSAVQVDSIYHTFGVEDESHPFKEKIFQTLKSLDTLVESDLITALFTRGHY